MMYLSFTHVSALSRLFSYDNISVCYMYEQTLNMSVFMFAGAVIVFITIEET